MPCLNQSCLRIGLLVLLLAVQSAANRVQAAGNSHVQWETNVDRALELSRSTRRPVLIQMTASWCGWCHRMLETTLEDEQVVQTINSQFVPLLLDADEHERLVEAIKVGAFPSTIIVSHDLSVIGRIEGYQRPAEFIRKLRQFERVAPLDEHAVAPTPSGGLNGAPTLTSVMLPLPSPVRTAGIDGPADSARTGSASQSALGDVQLTASNESRSEPGFQGLCLVSLLEDRRITTGSPEITTIYHGRTLQFATADSRAAFLRDPDRYWPLFDGHCPVALAAGEEQTVGTPATVAVFRGHLLMFRSLDSRQRFAADPAAYLKHNPAVAR